MRASVLSSIVGLQQSLERYVTILTEIADPDLAVAQIQACEATAQQVVATERSLRLAAEVALSLIQQEVQSEREAAELASESLETAEARIRILEEETEQKIAQLQEDQNRTIERLQVEAEQKMAEVEKQANEAIGLAQAATRSAQGETQQAETLKTQAQAQATTAERLLQETQTALERERAEWTTTRDQASKREESDRAEARKALEREQAEIDRLRGELTAARTRADQLVTLTDDLRAQLLQVMMTKTERTGGTS